MIGRRECGPDATLGIEGLLDSPNVCSRSKIAPSHMEADGLWFQPLMERHFPEKLAMASRTGPNGKLFATLFRHRVLLSTCLQGLCVGSTTQASDFSRHRRAPGFNDVGARSTQGRYPLQTDPAQRFTTEIRLFAPHCI